MSKKKYIAILPGLAILSLVGAGFSTWYFQTNDSKSTNIDVVVTDYLDIGRLEVTGGLKLVLDQTADRYEDQKGLHFEGELVLTYYLPTWNSFNGEDAGSDQTAENVITDIDDSQLSWTYTVEALKNDDDSSVDATFRKYITWESKPEITKESNPGWTLKEDESRPNERIYTLTLNEANMTPDNVFAFSYATSGVGITGEPKSLAEYEQMVADLQGTHLKFSVGVEFNGASN